MASCIPHHSNSNSKSSPLIRFRLYYSRLVKNNNRYPYKRDCRILWNPCHNAYVGVNLVTLGTPEYTNTPSTAVQPVIRSSAHQHQHQHQMSPGNKPQELETVPETVVREMRDTDASDASKKGLVDNIYTVVIQTRTVPHSEKRTVPHPPQI